MAEVIAAMGASHPGSRQRFSALLQDGKQAETQYYTGFFILFDRLLTYCSIAVFLHNCLVSPVFLCWLSEVILLMCLEDYHSPTLGLQQVQDVNMYAISIYTKSWYNQELL